MAIRFAKGHGEKGDEEDEKQGGSQFKKALAGIFGMGKAVGQTAEKRAEQIVENAGGKIKDLQSASLGVFQITAQNANENYSAGGAFNTWSKDKTVSVTVRLKYQVK